MVVHAQRENISVCSFESLIRKEDSNSTGMLTTGICTACPVYAYPSSDLSTCISCPDPLNMIAIQSGAGYTCQCLSGRAFQPVPVSLDSTLIISNRACAYQPHLYNLFSSNIVQILIESTFWTSFRLQAPRHPWDWIQTFSKISFTSRSLSARWVLRK